MKHPLPFHCLILTAAASIVYLGKEIGRQNRLFDKKRKKENSLSAKQID